MTAPRTNARRRPLQWWRQNLSSLVWALLLAVTLSLHFWHPPEDNNQLHDSYSTTAEGHKAFFRLLKSYSDDWYADRNHGTFGALKASYYPVETTLCLLGPVRQPKPEEWDTLLEFVAEGGSLLYAIRSNENVVVPETGVEYVPLFDELATEDRPPPETDLVDSPSLLWWRDGELSNERGEVLVEQFHSPQVVRVAHGRGEIVVVSGDWIFGNQLLGFGDNSRLALAILEAARRERSYVIVDEFLNATGTPKVVGLLTAEPLRPLSVHLLTLCVIYGWWNSRRFGPWLPSPGSPRRSVIDHTDMLGTLYWRAGAGREMLAGYLQSLQRRWHLRGDASHRRRRLASHARRSGETVEQMEQTLDEAAALVEQPRVARKQAAAMIGRLSRLQATLRPKVDERPDEGRAETS